MWLLGILSILFAIPDVSSNYVTLTVTDNVINTNSNYSIIIEKMEGWYSVKFTFRGYYIEKKTKEN